MAYKFIIVETRGKTGLITINRPDVLNALNSDVIAEMVKALKGFEKDEKIGCVVLTGSPKAFAAGADIKEMQNMSYMDAFLGDHVTSWDEIPRFRKPMIAAVAGYALGIRFKQFIVKEVQRRSDNS